MKVLIYCYRTKKNDILIKEGVILDIYEQDIELLTGINTDNTKDLYEVQEYIDKNWGFYEKKLKNRFKPTGYTIIETEIKHRCRRFPKGWMNKDLEIIYDKHDKAWWFQGTTYAGHFNTGWLERINFCPYCGISLNDSV